MEKARIALQKTEKLLTASDLHTTVLQYGQSSLAEAKRGGAMAKGALTQPKGLSCCPEEIEKGFKGLPCPLCHGSSNCMAGKSPGCFPMPRLTQWKTQMGQPKRGFVSSCAASLRGQRVIRGMAGGRLSRIAASYGHGMDGEPGMWLAPSYLSGQGLSPSHQGVL